MPTSLRLSLTAFILVPLCIINAAPELKQAPDHSVAAKAAGYDATIDPDGKLTLSMKGVPVVEQHFEAQASVPVSVNIIAQTVAVRSGTARVEYTFGDDTIKIITDGFLFQMHTVGPFKAVIVPGGRGGSFHGKGYGNLQALALEDGTCLAVSIPFMLNPNNIPRISPSCYANGSGKKPGDTLEFMLTLGQPATAVDLLSGIIVKPVGDDIAPLKEDGNTTGLGLVHFVKTEGASLTSTQENMNEKPFPVSYSLHIEDHYVAGHVVHEEKQDVELAPLEKHDMTWKLPKLAPGFYYATVTANSGAKKLTETKFPFTVDLAHYDHALTRPQDFDQFWTQQMTKLKQAEIKTNQVEQVITAADNPNKVTSGSFAVPGDRMLPWYLIMPEKAAPGTVAILPYRSGDLKQALDKMKQPGWIPDSPAMIFIFPLPDDATFTRWASREDNNMLDCIFAYVAALDFISARPETAGRKFIIGGGSRVGPLGFITTALRQEKVAACRVPVGTSVGMSWQDKPYPGWGMPPGLQAKDAQKVSAWAAINAYFDPVNHAQNVTCPVIFCYGILDNLAPAPGIEVLFHHTASSWKHISRNGGGHFTDDGFKKLDLELHTLAAASQGSSKEEERILKDH